MIVDTSALLAYFDRSEPSHTAVTAIIESANESLVVSPYVVAEVDYLVLTRHGSAAEHAVLRELSSGAWHLAEMSADRVAEALEIVERYADQPIGVADASNLVLARAYRTKTVVTLDRRHFSVLRFSDGSAPEVRP